MVNVEWKGGMAFEASPPSGCTFLMDSQHESDAPCGGPTPIETLLASIAACSAMDVVMILQKKRQRVTAYRIEVDGDRNPPGQFPRPFTAIRLKHIVSGENLDADAVQRAVALSDDKYCSVIATLRQSPPVSSTWEIVAAAPR